MINKEFSKIILEMNKNNNYCQGASQQMANGFYRIFDALEFISTELNGGSSLASVRSIRSTLNQNNVYCQGAPQQCANGAYRIVEILDVIISQLDKNRDYPVKTQAIIQEMNKNNIYCQGAPQQTANGTYRIVEMLEIVTKLIAPDKNTRVSASITQMNKTNIYCQGAPQQSANGTDAAFVILQYIVSDLDTKNSYGSTLSSIASLKSRNNTYCQGADQQSANNLYRIMETLQVLGKIMQDKADERTRAYWAEHHDEEVALKNEKRECMQTVASIKKEANAINENEKINKLSNEADALVEKKNLCGVDELNELQKVIDQRKEERAAIGFFKFGLRKEASLKIEEAKSAYNTKAAEINSQKNDIQSEIDAVNKKIKTINDDVEKRRAAKLSNADPYKARIKEIDYELTRRR